MSLLTTKTPTTSKPLWLAPPTGTTLITMRMTPHTPPFPADHETHVQRYWESRLAQNPRLFDGPIWVLTGWEVNDEGQDCHLLLQAHISSYKYVLYTHFSGESEISSFKALGASAITRTSDGFVVLGLRSAAVGTTPCTWHFAPAGNVDRADLRDLMASELSEELGIARWREMRVFGLFDAGKEQGHKTEIVFLIHLDETLAEVKQRFAALKDHEHEAVDGWKQFPEGIKLTEVAVAALTCFFSLIG